MNHTALTLLIFALTYAVIAVGKLPLIRLDRAGAAFAGAVAMVLAGSISESAARDAVDYHTLMLLFGMMIVVANLRLSGAFAVFARAMLLRARSGFGLLAMTVVSAGVLAAFFINDVVCLALTPLLIDAAELLGLNPVPFLLALATASNIGSAATITGNPQNMIVAGFAHLHYLPFAARIAPVSILGLVADYLVIAFAYRASLAHVRRNTGMLRAKPQHVIPALVMKSSVIAMAALVCFAMGFPTHLVALGAGAVLLFTRRIKPERVYRLVDWTMLVMFAGLFIVVAGLETTGIEAELLKWVGVERLSNPVTLSAVVAVLSNLVSNVPAVLLFRPLYPALGGNPQVALIISSASTLAGNLTVLGSVANLIVIEHARPRGVHISFWEYLRIGVPITIVTIAISLLLIPIGL